MMFMNQPVVIESGNTFDWWSISQWLSPTFQRENRNTDPMTNVILENPRIMIPNLILRSMIENYIKARYLEIYGETISIEDYVNDVDSDDS